MCFVFLFLSTGLCMHVTIKQREIQYVILPVIVLWNISNNKKTDKRTSSESYFHCMLTTTRFAVISMAHQVVSCNGCATMNGRVLYLIFSSLISLSDKNRIYQKMQREKLCNFYNTAFLTVALFISKTGER